MTRIIVDDDAPSATCVPHPPYPREIRDMDGGALD
jgi:hypothetical protein